MKWPHLKCVATLHCEIKCRFLDTNIPFRLTWNLQSLGLLNCKFKTNMPLKKNRNYFDELMKLQNLVATLLVMTARYMSTCRGLLRSSCFVTDNILASGWSWFNAAIDRPGKSWFVYFYDAMLRRLLRRCRVLRMMRYISSSRSSGTGMTWQHCVG